MRNINRLNEEIARWAFEILYKTNLKWEIAFTNPTAGPWKTIKGKSINGSVGEVYRFALEEDRPDIVMYNDELEVIIIFEAKDSLAKLLVDEQKSKSADVVINLSKKLSEKNSNIFWNKRSSYKVLLGLLWGSDEVIETEENKNKLFDSYRNLIINKKGVDDKIIIGIETRCTNNVLRCFAYYKVYNNLNDEFAKKVCESLILSNAVNV